jgi:hypothetical protein
VTSAERLDHPERVAAEVSVEHGADLLRECERGLQQPVCRHPVHAHEVRAQHEQRTLVEQREAERGGGHLEHRVRGRPVEAHAFGRRQRGGVHAPLDPQGAEDRDRPEARHAPHRAGETEARHEREHERHHRRVAEQRVDERRAHVGEAGEQPLDRGLEREADHREHRDAHEPRVLARAEQRGGDPRRRDQPDRSHRERRRPEHGERRGDRPPHGGVIAAAQGFADLLCDRQPEPDAGRGAEPGLAGEYLPQHPDARGCRDPAALAQLLRITLPIAPTAAAPPASHSLSRRFFHRA